MNLCAIKDICSKDAVILGDALEDSGSLVLVAVFYTIEGPDTPIYDIFGKLEIVKTRQIVRRKLWVRKEDIIYPKESV